jgi:hypothetical protein
MHLREVGDWRKTNSEALNHKSEIESWYSLFLDVDDSTVTLLTFRRSSSVATWEPIHLPRVSIFITCGCGTVVRWHACCCWRGSSVYSLQTHFALFSPMSMEGQINIGFVNEPLKSMRVYTQKKEHQIILIRFGGFNLHVKHPFQYVFTYYPELQHVYK